MLQLILRTGAIEEPNRNIITSWGSRTHEFYHETGLSYPQFLTKTG